MVTSYTTSFNTQNMRIVPQNLLMICMKLYKQEHFFSLLTFNLFVVCVGDTARLLRRRNRSVKYILGKNIRFQSLYYCRGMSNLALYFPQRFLNIFIDFVAKMYASFLAKCTYPSKQNLRILCGKMYASLVAKSMYPL